MCKKIFRLRLPTIIRDGWNSRILRVALALILEIPFACMGGLAQTTLPASGAVILGSPTDHSIRVFVTFPANQEEVYLEYAESPSTVTQQTAIQRNILANQPYQETVTGLAPDREYTYRIRYRSQIGRAHV